jgi:hypothetical protein
MSESQEVQECVIEQIRGTVTLKDFVEKVVVNNDLILLDDERADTNELVKVYLGIVKYYYTCFLETYGISDYGRPRGYCDSKSDTVGFNILCDDAAILCKSLLHVLGKYNYEAMFDKYLRAENASRVKKVAVRKKVLSIVLGLLCAIIFLGGGTLFIIAFVKKLSFMLHNLNTHNALIAYKICGPICFAIAIATAITALICIARSNHEIYLGSQIEMQSGTYCNLLPKKDLTSLMEELQKKFLCLKKWQIDSESNSLIPRQDR